MHTLRDLMDHLPDVTRGQRNKRGLADGLPQRPGVYLFRGPNDEVLYVGTASNLNRRVRHYFTAGEKRSRIKEMVALAERVDHVECAHPLEAQVRELRLLSAHQPRYNRRSKFPQRAWWAVFTDEAFPRLSIVRRPKDGALGPFRSRQAAVDAVEVLQSVTLVRRCHDRIPAKEQRGRPCALHELNRCNAPCAGLESVEDYEPHVRSVQEVVDGHGDDLLHRLAAEVHRLSEQHRFEDAADQRDHLAALIRSLDRAQRLRALARIPELVAAQPDGSGGWNFAVVRHGRLASAGSARRGEPPMPVVDALQRSAETVRPEPGPLRGASPDEAHVLQRWLSTDGTRMVRCHEPWSEPAGSAASWHSWLERATTARTPYAAVD